jgi:hypothetical protein
MDDPMPRRSFWRHWRLVAAFLIAPGASAVLMAIVSPLFEGLDGRFERVWRSAEVIALFGAYPLTAILGVPAFFLLRRTFAPTLLRCMLAGACIVGLPVIIVSLLAVPESASVDGRATVVEGSQTLLGLIVTLTVSGQMALYGAFGGAVFWWGGFAGRRDLASGDPGGAIH